MHFSQSALALSSFFSLSAAHFSLTSPPSRGENYEQLVQFPCGGQKTPSTRTKVSLSDPKINLAMEMGHDQTAIQVLIGLGSDPGSNYNITVVPTFRQVGLGDFCLPDVLLDEKHLGFKPTDGMEATLQVVTNGDPIGGLYFCADLVFATTGDTPGKCKNGTGVSATLFTGDAAKRNANESTPNGQAQQGSGGARPSTTASASPSASASARPSSAAGHLEKAGWGILGAVMAGGLAML